MVLWFLVHAELCTTVNCGTLHHSKRKPHPVSSHPSPTTANSLSICLFWTFPTSGITPCVSCVCCLPEHHVLRVCPCGSRVRASLLFLAEGRSHVWRDTVSFSADGPRLFPLWVVLLWASRYTLLWLYLFFWVWCVCWSRIGLAEALVTLWRSCQTVFPVAAPCLIPEPHGAVPLSPPPCQHWFLWPGGWGGGTGRPVVALWFRFPCQVLWWWARGLPATCGLPQIRVCAQVLCLLFNWVICLLVLTVGAPYIFWIQVSHQMWFANIFSYSVGCLLTFLMVSFNHYF